MSGADRELLELAAKAAGIVWDDDLEIWQPASGTGFVRYDWNPLTDDGDALRLAVKLNITVQFPWDENCRFLRETACWTADSTPWIELHATDPYAATRRAIVRAAAAMAPTT